MKPRLFILILLAGFSFPLFAQVTLYSSCNYFGFSKSLEKGYYNTNDLGIGNDKLSSIRVPDGYTITLYQDGDFKGQSTLYSSDISCLPGDWNDKVSSVYVNYERNYSNNEAVTLYMDCNYRGYSKSLGEGSYRVYELGISNDQLSSIRVPRGYSITLYQDDNFQGSSTRYEEDIPCLPVNWNDRTSSIVITRRWNNFGWNNNNNAVVVTLFSDCNYGGLNKSLGTGTYKYYELGIGNDQLSSIRISNGYSLVLFQDDNFQGQSITYLDDVACLNPNWNKKVSSVIISTLADNGRGRWNNNNNNIQNNIPVVTLFEGCSYLGQSSSLGTGYFNMSELGIPNDALSSLRVAPGYSVTLYKDDNFIGQLTTVTGDVSCLGFFINDRTSSIRVFRTGQ